MAYNQWRKECPKCHANLSDGRGTRLIHVVDRDKDCAVAYKCPACQQQWDRSIGEVICQMELG